MSPKPAVVLEGEPGYGTMTTTAMPAAELPSGSQEVGVASAVSGEGAQPQVVVEEQCDAVTLEVPHRGHQEAVSVEQIGQGASAVLGSMDSGPASISTFADGLHASGSEG